MADLSQKKLDFARRIGVLAYRTISLLADSNQAISYYFSNQFNSGGANQIQDSDLFGDVGYLTAAQVAGCITQLQTLVAAMPSSGVQDILRQCEKQITD